MVCGVVMVFSLYQSGEKGKGERRGFPKALIYKIYLALRQQGRPDVASSCASWCVLRWSAGSSLHDYL